MTLSVTDIVIIVDTIGGSLQIADNANIFRYTHEARKELMNRLLREGGETPALVEAIEEDGKEEPK
jgi:hypothetical protein